MSDHQAAIERAQRVMASGYAEGSPIRTLAQDLLDAEERAEEERFHRNTAIIAADSERTALQAALSAAEEREATYKAEHIKQAQRMVAMQETIANRDTTIREALREALTWVHSPATEERLSVFLAPASTEGKKE